MLADCMTLAHLNIRSLSKHFDEFALMEPSYGLQDCGIICLTETWLNKSHFDSRFNIPHYEFIRRDRQTNRRGGGLAIYMKESLDYVQLKLPGSDVVESLAIRICTKQGPLVLILLYCPPDKTRAVMPYLETVFDELALFSKKTVIIGDFNIDWNKDTNLKRELYDFMTTNGFKQLVQTFSRVSAQSKTVIDLLFSNSDVVSSTGVCPCDISDHDIIKCKISMKQKPSPFNFIYKRDFSKFSDEIFFNEAKYLPFFKAEQIHCPNEAAAFLESLIAGLVNKHAPFKKIKLKTGFITWKTPDITKLIKTKSILYKLYREKGMDKNSIEWLEYKRVRNQTTSAIRAAKIKAFKSVIDNPELGPWVKIRLIKGSNATSSKIDSMKLNGKISTSPYQTADMLNEYFSTIGSNLNKSISTTHSNPVTEASKNGFHFDSVDISTVAKVLASLKNKKNGGLNQIPAYIYKLLEPLILSPLTHVINISISGNTFPLCWKQALVIPIFKGGDDSTPNNYRPISLLPILSKVLEKIIAAQINHHLSLHVLIGSRQFGFRSGCSTDQLLFQLTNKFKQLLSKKESKFLSIASLDIKKAFDSVNHNLLLTKLNTFFNFESSATLFIKDYLSNRFQSVKCNNTISQLRPVQAGVPQGSILGPLLFIMFINDIMALNNCYLYADDCLVVYTGHTPEASALKLENSLIDFVSWYKRNLLVLNASKTDLMTISNKPLKTNSLPMITINESKLKQSDKIKYLGLVLDNKLKFNKSISLLKKKTFPVIQNLAINRKFISGDVAALWYKCIIRPILEYGASVHYDTRKSVIKNLLSIEYRCLKIIDKGPKTETRQRFNIPSIENRLKYLYLVSFFKLTHNYVPLIDDGLLPHRAASSTRLGMSGGFLLGKNSIYLGCRLYNNLPHQIRAIQSLKDFKKELKFHLIYNNEL